MILLIGIALLMATVTILCFTFIFARASTTNHYPWVYYRPSDYGKYTSTARTT